MGNGVGIMDEQRAELALLSHEERIAVLKSRGGVSAEEAEQIARGIGAGATTKGGPARTSNKPSESAEESKDVAGDLMQAASRLSASGIGDQQPPSIVTVQQIVPPLDRGDNEYEQTDSISSLSSARSSINSARSSLNSMRSSFNRSLRNSARGSGSQTGGSFGGPQGILYLGELGDANVGVLGPTKSMYARDALNCDDDETTVGGEVCIMFSIRTHLCFFSVLPPNHSFVF